MSERARDTLLGFAEDMLDAKRLDPMCVDELFP